MITPFRSVSRCAVEERDGRFYVAGTRIHVSAGVTLDDSTVWRIDDALTAEAQEAGSNMPVCLSHKATRLIRCGACGAPFIAHPAARLCSPACRLKASRASQRKASAKRTIERDERRAALLIRCRQCGEPVQASRSTKAFCSAACRVAAARARRS